jgi:hypothetical protein
MTFYRSEIRPLVFSLDAEASHRAAIALCALGRVLSIVAIAAAFRQTLSAVTLVSDQPSRIAAMQAVLAASVYVFVLLQNRSRTCALSHTFL